MRSTWNLFRSTIYELKLCTSYFWSTSVRPFVRQNGRNIASHTGLLVIFYDPPNEVGGSLCFCLVRPASVRPGGKKKYGLKTRFRGFWVCFGCFWRFRLLSVRPSGQWMGYVLCRELVLGVWGLEPETNLKWMNIYWNCAPPIFLDVRLDRRSVWERSELRLFNM